MLCRLILISLLILPLAAGTAFADEQSAAAAAAGGANDEDAAFAEKLESARAARNIKRQQAKAESPLSTSAGNAVRKVCYFLGGLLLIAGIVKRLQKPTDAGSGPGMISVVARTGVTPRSALLVVTVDGERFLLAQNQDDLSLISPLQEAVPFGEIEARLESEMQAKINRKAVR